MYDAFLIKAYAPIFVDPLSFDLVRTISMFCRLPWQDFRELRMENLRMCATIKVDGHVNVLSVQMNGVQLYQGRP